MSARDELLALLRRDAYREGRFRLASGKESDFFIDCKRVMLTAEGHRLAGEALCEEVSTLSPAPVAVAGVALGGCPLASAVSLTSALRHAGPDGRGWNALYVRKEAKDHGTARRIEGVAPAGAEVVLLEDVLTTGGSSLTAIGALRAEGFTVRRVIALVDRAEGAVAALADAGVTASGLFHRGDFVR
ncbi:MAG: orotate phosphoribosyltransferase [Polyangiales bacterium]